MKKKSFVRLALFTVLCGIAVPVFPLPIPIGANLAKFKYYNTDIPFKDLMIQSNVIGLTVSKSNKPCSTTSNFDPEGYPLTIPSGCSFVIKAVYGAIDSAIKYKAGHYSLIYQGEGQISLSLDPKNVNAVQAGRMEFDVNAPSNNGITVTITSTNPANHIHDIHIVHKNDESTFKSQPFNEDWLNLLKPFSALRFMDWGQVADHILAYTGAILKQPNSTTLVLSADASHETNAYGGNMIVSVLVNGNGYRSFIDNYDGSTRTLHLTSPLPTGAKRVVIEKFANVNWADRPSLNTLAQTSDSGIAFEYMIQLANTLNINPWINIPTGASDDFVTGLATMIKTNLKPELKCYIEYSNETWNTSGYPGYIYSVAKTNALNLPKLQGQFYGDAWHSYRAVEIFKIFNSVFQEPDLHAERSSSRLLRVITSQGMVPMRMKGVTDWVMPDKGWPNNGHKTGEYADVLAGTAYFNLKKNDNQDVKYLKSASIPQLIAKHADILDRIYGTANSPGPVREDAKIAKDHHLQFVIYEGGFQTLSVDDATDLKLTKMQDDPCMKPLYTMWLKRWNELYNEYGSDTIGVMNQFNAISNYSPNGYWGLMQSTYNNPLQAPKYQAVLTYSGLNSNTDITQCNGDSIDLFPPFNLRNQS